MFLIASHSSTSAGRKYYWMCVLRRGLGIKGGVSLEGCPLATWGVQNMHWGRKYVLPEIKYFFENYYVDLSNSPTRRTAVKKNCAECSKLMRLRKTMTKKLDSEPPWGPPK